METWYQVYFEQFEKRFYPFPPGSTLSKEKGLSIPEVGDFNYSLKEAETIVYRFLQQQANTIDNIRRKTGPPTPDENVIQYQVKPPFEVYVALALVHYIVEFKTPPEDRESLDVSKFIVLLSRGIKQEMELLPACGNKNKPSRETIEKRSKRKQISNEFQWNKRYQYALLWGATENEAWNFSNSWEYHSEFLENEYVAALED